MVMFTLITQGRKIALSYPGPGAYFAENFRGIAFILIYRLQYFLNKDLKLGETTPGISDYTATCAGFQCFRNGYSSL
jgi:hypothetical protein